MSYVALLRGINVGGNNKIDMKLLKKAFEEVGMTSVTAYINTGNIIFTSEGLTKTHITSILEDAIHTNFGLSIKVLVLSFVDIKRVIDAIPESWTNDKQMRSDVMFLWEDVDDESVMEKLIIKSEIDTVKYVPGAILWSMERKNAAKSGMSKIIGTNVYKRMTVRNVNTTRKIYELMQALELK